MLDRIQRIADHLKSLTDGFTPETGIILGTGLSGLSQLPLQHIGEGRQLRLHLVRARAGDFE